MANTIVRRIIGKTAIYCGLIFLSASALAKDLFVSTTGSDTVSYEANSIATPWATITKGIYSLKAGDTLHIRGGTYVQANSLTIHSQRRNGLINPTLSIVMNAETGTAEKPITVKNYDGEMVTIDLALTNGFFLTIDDKEYWNFSGLKFINAGTVFYVGQDAKSYYHTFRNLDIIANKTVGNNGAITIYGQNAEYAIIANNKIRGSGEFNTEAEKLNSCIYARRVRHIKILNNECQKALIGIHYKHRTLNATESGDTAPIDIEIAYNFINGTNRSSMYLNTREAHVHNNLMGTNNAGLVNNQASGDAGGDFNKYEHNTFFTGALNFLSDTQSYQFNGVTYPDQYPGSRYNTVKNNIFVQGVAWHWYDETLSHNTSSNHNLYPQATAVNSNQIAYAVLASWQQFSGQDANSLQGAPVFAGGATPTTISGFALTSASPGYRKASDGKDMGADVTKVGVKGSVSVQANPLPLDFVN